MADILLSDIQVGFHSLLKSDILSSMHHVQCFMGSYPQTQSSSLTNELDARDVPYIFFCFFFCIDPTMV